MNTAQIRGIREMHEATTAKAGHTPGPWSHGISRQRKAIFAPSRLSIPIAYVGGNGQNGYTETANARLIASAPDLLAALKSAVSYLEANRPKGKIREIFTQLNEYENGVLKPARAAILQAEGGAQ